MPTLSIIVPVWNAAQWLDACVRSVVEQSCTDWELLLFDNGSRDNSGALCEAWAARDPRIRVFHKGDTGPAHTRNVGIEEARGRYLTFLDSDDELLPGILERAVAEMEQGWELVSFGYTCQFEDHSYDMICPAFTAGSRDQLWPHFEEYYHTTGQFCFVWNKLYRADIIAAHGLRFDPSLFNGEDILFNFGYFSHIRKISVLDIPGYRYWSRNSSLSRRVGRDHLEVCETTIGWAREFFALAGAPASALPEFEKAQLLANVSGYYSSLTDSSMGYSLGDRIRRLTKIFRTPRYREVLLPWLKHQQGLQYTYLRFAASLNSPVLTALPVALKASLRGVHHA